MARHQPSSLHTEEREKYFFLPRRFGLPHSSFPMSGSCVQQLGGGGGEQPCPVFNTRVPVHQTDFINLMWLLEPVRRPRAYATVRNWSSRDVCDMVGGGGEHTATARATRLGGSANKGQKNVQRSSKSMKASSAFFPPSSSSPFPSRPPSISISFRRVVVSSST